MVRLSRTSRRRTTKGLPHRPQLTTSVSSVGDLSTAGTYEKRRPLSHDQKPVSESLAQRGDPSLERFEVGELRQDDGSSCLLCRVQCTWIAGRRHDDDWNTPTGLVAPQAGDQLMQSEIARAQFRHDQLRAFPPKGE
jgi:hypothetical protein